MCKWLRSCQGGGSFPLWGAGLSRQGPVLHCGSGTCYERCFQPLHELQRFTFWWRYSVLALPHASQAAAAPRAAPGVASWAFSAVIR